MLLGLYKCADVIHSPENMLALYVSARYATLRYYLAETTQPYVSLCSNDAVV